MLEINEATFEENTKEGLVLVDFYAPWCGPCRALAPILAQLDGQSVKVVKMNTDENTQFAAQNAISALPTLVFYKNGVEVDRVIGLTNLQYLQDRVKKLA